MLLNQGITRHVPVYVPANWFDSVPHVTPIYAKRWIPTVSQNGTGTVLRSGNVYEGDFREGRFHGRGVFWFADGRA
jgi:hypothetical protein